MARSLLAALDRFNQAHPWSHNDAYASNVVRAARKVRRAGGKHCLDIGCGTGGLVARLAHELPNVTGIEPDKKSAKLATEAVAAVPTARIIQASFPADDGTRYDLVSMVAVLHHLPLTAGIRSLRKFLAPSGRLIIVGMYRETPTEMPLSVLSVVLNSVVGLIKHPRKTASPLEHMTAPTVEPIETFQHIKATMEAELPGVVIRRGLFWRYTARWTAPVP